MRISDLINLGVEGVKFALCIVILSLLIYLIMYKLIYQKIFGGSGKIDIRKMVPNLLLALVILVILFATLLRFGGGAGQLNLIPFSSYRLAWYQFNYREWRNLILNICMFVPFGFILPFVREEFRKSWKTYRTGLLFSLGIEVLQFIFERGIFETDDLINNLLGTMIGYGFFSLIQWIKKKKSLKEALVYQIPLFCVVILFTTIFCLYSAKELGNLECEYSSNYNMPEVILNDEVKLSKDETTVSIYKMKIASLDETRQLAEEIFATQNKKIDENRIDIYDDTAIYYCDDSSLCVWIDFKGMTIKYTNFELEYPEDGSECKYLIGADEDIVRESIKKIGINIPENTVFAVDQNIYSFEIKDEVKDDGFNTGIVNCRLNDDGEVLYVYYNIISGEPYKKVDIISSEEAYEKLCDGKFYYYNRKIESDTPYTVKAVKLTYQADSKGFYRPVYEFELMNDGYDEAISICILAEKK